MDIKAVKKVINSEFDKVEKKVDLLNNTLSEGSKNQISKEAVTYIALFFDGEGNIGINKKTLSLQTHITNTNLDVLIRIKNIFKGEINVHQKKTEIRKKSWNWQLNDRDNIKFFLETILPYSTIKRSQILDGLEFLEKITTIKYRRGGMSSEERKFRESIYYKLQEPKHHIYTQEDINNLQTHIDNTKQSQEVFDEYVYSGFSGFFDAEGCVSAPINKRYDNIHLRTNVSNTYPFILIGMKQVFSGNVRLQPKSKHPKWRQTWTWMIETKKDVKFFLTKILPYSIIKRPQIELGIKFLETDNYQTKLFISKKLEKMKDETYTTTEEKELYDQIEDMNIDKLQHKLEYYK